MTRHKRHRFKLRSIYQWHRYIGVAISLLVIYLSVTGIMLNHTEELELDNSQVSSSWLLDWYGIQTPDKIISFQAGDFWVSQWQQDLFINEKPIGRFPGQLQGSMKLPLFIAIALENTLLLVSHEGELIEQLDKLHGVPSNISAIGLSESGNPTIKAMNTLYSPDAEFLSWRTVNKPAVDWSTPAALPPRHYQRLNEIYRGMGLTLERITLDLHSGRILGIKGVYFTDILATLLICLAGSGLWLWAMRFIRNNQRGKKQPR